jgi:tRNA-dihydrouridine synthase B
VDRDGRAHIIRRHCALIDAHLPPRDALVQLKKHLAWYSAGLPGSARLRTALFQAEDAAAVREVFWSAW